MASRSGGRIMPPPFPMTITQIAVVVADIESALRSYTENLGWGPWSVFDYKPPLLHDTVVRGQPCEFRMIGAETIIVNVISARSSNRPSLTIARLPCPWPA
jgi:hypothetical protein